VIRDAVPADVKQLLRLVGELALYEDAPEAVEATEEGLHRALFGPDPKVFALVAEPSGLVVRPNVRPVVGMAFYFVSFSTWTGRHGLYVEDLFVEPEYRSQGFGRALLAGVCARAVQLGCARVEWAVLDWKTPALEFYRSLGAVPLDGWTTYRLSGHALTEFGDRVQHRDQGPPSLSLDGP
jgi:GNAT superfamily N-acetyltransferase